MVIPLRFAAPPPNAEDPDCAAVAAALEEEILIGRLLPRERLLGEALAVRFGVSRNAVRRAFAVLAQRGIVTIAPNRGAQVRDFTESEIVDLVETRAVLQRHAASHLPLPAPAALLAQLEAAAAAHLDAIHRRDLPAVLAANAAFHDTLFRAAGNAVVADAIVQLSWLLTVIRAYRMGDPSTLEAGALGHAEMVAALRAGDAARLLAAVEAHVSSAAVIAARRVTWRWKGEVVRLG
jgi:DNA-binding GntR family transcriptional regulator